MSFWDRQSANFACHKHYNSDKASNKSFYARTISIIINHNRPYDEHNQNYYY